MSTFWIIYWIAIGIIVVFSLFAILFFDISEKRYNGYNYKPIPVAYLILAVLVGAIPGIGILGSVVLVGLICVAVTDGDLRPKEHPFGEKDDDE